MITLLLLCIGCSEKPAQQPQPVSVKAPAPNVVHWELVGRVTPNQSVWPDAPPFEGGRDMIARCKDRRPCAAERWRAQDGTEMDTVLIERTLFFKDGREPWPARWMSITGVLRSCLGDPLTIPPTDDPASIRTLETVGDDATWALHLSGQNSCGLVGQVRLNAKKDVIDLDALRCEAKRWQEGGKQCALKKKKAALSPEKVAE